MQRAGFAGYVVGDGRCGGWHCAHLERRAADGLQRLSSFAVDPKTGVVSHVSPIEADAAIVSRMKAACAK